MSVCDTCSTNASTVNGLAYPNITQTKQTGELLQYKINGHLITHTYDPPHLIKVVRNNLEVKNLMHFINQRWEPGSDDYDGCLQIAAWSDIDHLYRMDLLAVERMLPKLTDEHLKPSKLKMKVSVATQIFSNTLGTEMLRRIEQGELPENFTGTARFILFMNDLFDSVNGSDKHAADSLRGAITPISKHLMFWDYALVMLENMFFVDKDTAERNNRSSVLEKFRSTIQGYREVAKTCFKSGISKVNLRYHYFSLHLILSTTSTLLVGYKSIDTHRS